MIHTWARVEDIKDRLREDFYATFRREGLLSDAALIDGLLNDAMFQVEVLLAEMEKP